MNHLFNARTYNLFGRIRIRPAPITAAASSIGQVAVKVPQIFYRFDCDTIVDADDARFTIFKEKVNRL